MNRRTKQDPAPPSTADPIRTTGHKSPVEPKTAPLQNTAARVAAVTLGAVFAALAVWVIAVPVAGVALVAGGVAVSPAAVALVSLGSGCAAGLSYTIMRRFRGGTAMWTITACVVLGLSMAGPPLSGATGSAVVALELMHLVVGVTMILGMRRVVPSSPGSIFDHDAAALDSDPSTAQSE
ncbi:DUF6069 family protein [Brevibacterium sp. CFH 10365]|uniref:DUF6069 family protein n=1 Tax=Brevibacterium sp. CFH 10365 TaxID=2585207 RepID=UPI0012661B84|nr:DUF6069 family protein [Brevibacterium sp. CFH 10365]